MENPNGFKEAFEELKSILSKLENDEVGIDELDALMDRAQFLKNYCDNKLLSSKNNLEIKFSS